MTLRSLHKVVSLAVFWSIFAVLLYAEAALAALVRQPYLQLVTPSSVTIVWRTDSASGPFNNSQVQYGTSSTNLNLTATGVSVTPASTSGVKDHFVTITTGLDPATKYFYNVGTTTGGPEGGGTTQHFFVTAPTTGSSTPFRVWALGDSGDGSTRQIAVRDAMQNATAGDPPDLIWHLGDIAYNSGTDSEFTTKHFAVYQDILRNTPLYPSFGNHEAGSSSATSGTGPYFEGHVLPTLGEAGGAASGTEAYYSFDYANVHFIVLDSQEHATDSTMLNWLQQDLVSTTQQWIIAYFHHPPYSKGTHNSDNGSDSGGRLRDMRENVLPILEAGGVDLVLSGHSHAYERSYLIDSVYGYGSSPNFATPSFSTLWLNGDIIDAGDGNPAGSGAYVKQPGVHVGAVYIVAGHGGQPAGGTGGHPVMVSEDLVSNGSVLLDFNDSILTARALRTNGTFADLFSIDKSAGLGPAANVVITQPGADFAAGGNTALQVTVQDAAGNRITTDDTTEITFSPTLNGTITGVVTGTGDGSYGVVAGAETVTVASGVATVTLTDNVEETFQVAITNNAGLNNPLDDSITVTAAPTGGLVVAYAFEEGIGTTTQDWSGNGNNGTLINGPLWVAGQMGLGLSLDGVNDYVETGNTVQLPTWTASAWVISPTAPSSGVASGPINRNSNYQINWNHPNAAFRGVAALRVGTTWHAASFGPLAANTWYYLAATYDGETLNAYKDGVLITSNTAPSGPPTSETNSLKIGRHAAAAQFFQGTFDEIRVYNRALTEAEIQSDMLTPVAPPP